MSAKLRSTNESGKVNNARNLEQVTNAMDHILKEMKNDLDKIKRRRNLDDGKATFVVDSAKVPSNSPPKTPSRVDPKIANLIKKVPEQFPKKENSTTKSPAEIKKSSVDQPSRILAPQVVTNKVSILKKESSLYRRSSTNKHIKLKLTSAPLSSSGSKTRPPQGARPIPSVRSSRDSSPVKQKPKAAQKPRVAVPTVHKTTGSSLTRNNIGKQLYRTSAYNRSSMIKKSPTSPTESLRRNQRPVPKKSSPKFVEPGRSRQHVASTLMMQGKSQQQILAKKLLMSKIVTSDRSRQSADRKKSHTAKIVKNSYAVTPKKSQISRFSRKSQQIIEKNKSNKSLASSHRNSMSRNKIPPYSFQHHVKRNREKSRTSMLSFSKKSMSGSCNLIALHNLKKALSQRSSLAKPSKAGISHKNVTGKPSKVTISRKSSIAKRSKINITRNSSLVKPSKITIGQKPSQGKPSRVIVSRKSSLWKTSKVALSRKASARKSGNISRKSSLGKQSKSAISNRKTSSSKVKKPDVAAKKSELPTVDSKHKNKVRSASESRQGIRNGSPLITQRSRSVPLTCKVKNADKLTSSSSKKLLSTKNSANNNVNLNVSKRASNNNFNNTINRNSLNISNVINKNNANVTITRNSMNNHAINMTNKNMMLNMLSRSNMISMNSNNLPTKNNMINLANKSNTTNMNSSIASNKNNAANNSMNKSSVAINNVRGNTSVSKTLGANPSSNASKEAAQMKQNNILKQSTLALLPKKPTESHVANSKPQVISSLSKATKLNASSEFVSSGLYPTKRSSSPTTVTPAQILGKNDPMQEVMNIVNRAKWGRKTFTVCGNFAIIRRALLQRGWIEKLRIQLVDGDGWRKLETMSNYELLDGMKNREIGDRYRRALYSKLLARHQVDLYWDYMTNPFTVCSDKVKRTLINRYPMGSNRCFTTKTGLQDTLTDAHWYYIFNVANVMYPRTYNLALEYDRKAFIDDFRTTAAASLLKWVIRIASDNVLQLVSTSGKIPTAVFNFALLQCLYYIRIKQHKDIDEEMPSIEDHEWNIFLDKFYQVIHSSHHFKATNKMNKEQMVEQAKDVVSKMERYCPEMRNDGIMNLWILKPHYGCRGCGILVCRTLKFILDTVSQRNQKTKYIVQKYLERPLLIYNTKFDIRQWILITNQPNLNVWMYKECYLRFSSQTYNLHKLHESIHLTNNSVQCRYKNCNRDTNLPDQNMWHSDTFKQYLDNIGQPTAWNKIIYKGMKECLVAVFMLCQDKLFPRVNSFELCGADFMLTEEFQPYLIEINSRPALHWSTKVTAKMCPQVLEDVIKVVVDHARNPKSSTGKFELIYRGQISKNHLNEKELNVLQIRGRSAKISDPNHSTKTETKCEKLNAIKNEISAMIAEKEKADTKIEIKNKIIEAKKEMVQLYKDKVEKKTEVQLYKDKVEKKTEEKKMEEKKVDSKKVEEKKSEMKKAEVKKSEDKKEDDKKIEVKKTEENKTEETKAEVKETEIKTNDTTDDKKDDDKSGGIKKIVDEHGKISEFLSIRKDEIKRDIKSTLQQILSVVNHDDDVSNSSRLQRSNEFKDMLSEFVDIISTGSQLERPNDSAK